jgi:ribosomal protein L11 methyltransferase
MKDSAWLELTLRLKPEALPQTEALLALAGSVSIAVADAGEAPILEPAPGATPLWPSLTVRALFPDNVDADALGMLVGPLAEGEPAFARIADAAIVARSAAPIVAIEIGPRLAIVPAEALPTADRRALGLHMGLAFGTGSHPTTRLCLEWLERELEPGISVLDYGSGSGILALAALKLGAASATAVDTEPQARTATKRNAELNGLTGALTISSPESLATQRFDLIVANILARPLIELAASFARLQPAGGRIVLSGILGSQLAEVESHYSAGYEAFSSRELSGWGLLTGTRRAV